MNIDTSLLREKFIINEKNASSKANSLELVCPSTRMALELKSGELPAETFIVRTYNMHSCVRMVAEIIDEYKANGNIIGRQKKVAWDKLWNASLSPYDKIHNPNDWVAIYNNGDSVFSSGKYHQLFDVIEKCDTINNDSYESSIKLAEDYFAKAGKEIEMIYDSNVALVAVLGRHNGRCSVVLRGADKTTTFNYSLQPIVKNKALNIPQGINLAASFLEAIQLSYMVGEDNKNTDRAAKALKRIDMLDSEISSMEYVCDVNYRPERPNFSRIMAQYHD